MAGPGRHGPRADGDQRPALHLGRDAVAMGRRLRPRRRRREFHVVAIDYGIKRNILRLLAGLRLPGHRGAGADLAPTTSSRSSPTASFSPTAPAIRPPPAQYAVPVIRGLIDAGLPTFGICLGHQMLGIAVGGRTMKMHQGHHGANHPVKDLTTGKVEITSMNHGFAVDRATPAGERRVRPTCRCSTAPIAASRSRTGRCSRCNTIPRPRPARATATICSPASPA